MRVITLIVVHCSAVKPDQTSSVAQIDRYHRKDRHYKIEPGRPEWMVGAHCLNHNRYSIGICYEGGLDARGQPEDTRTLEQKLAMLHLLEVLHRRYPKALIVGHRDLSHDRDCPCFDAVKEYADLQPK